MKYFKVMRGFGQDDFIPIDETELEKALYAHIVGNVTATFKNGSIVGSHISAIMPDYHATMGWNYGHKMGPDDWDEVNQRGVTKAVQGMIGEARDRVRYFINTKRTDLIGTGAKIEASAEVRGISAEIGKLAQAKKI